MRREGLVSCRSPCAASGLFLQAFPAILFPLTFLSLYLISFISPALDYYNSTTRAVSWTLPGDSSVVAPRAESEAQQQQQPQQQQQQQQPKEYPPLPSEPDTAQ
jgi:hypothetical protein